MPPTAREARQGPLPEPWESVPHIPPVGCAALRETHGGVEHRARLEQIKERRHSEVQRHHTGAGCSALCQEWVLERVVGATRAQRCSPARRQRAA